MVEEKANTPRDREKEKKQDIELNKRREILDNYFNRNYDYSPSYKEETYSDDSYLENTTSYKPFNDDFSDPLEKTGEIDNVGIEELKKLVAELKKLDYDDEQEESIGQSKSNGKVLTKVAPGYKKAPQEEQTEEKPNDNKEIGTSFMYCFILSLVTAAIGTGWLINIINQISTFM